MPARIFSTLSCGIRRTRNESMPRTFRQLMSAALALIAITSALALRQRPGAARQAPETASRNGPADGVDAVARLQRRIDAGETTLQFDPQHGYLTSLLK